MKKIRHIISCALLLSGMLLCLGAMGRLDYLAEQAAIGSGDMCGAVIKSIIGIVLMGAAAWLNYDKEFEEK